MKLTPEEVEEFEKITNYETKLASDKQNLSPRFELQIPPREKPTPYSEGINNSHVNKIHITPECIQEPKKLVDNYPNQFTESEIRDIVVRKSQAPTPIREAFSWELQCEEDSKKTPCFLTGYRYDQNSEREAKILLQYLLSPKHNPQNVRQSLIYRKTVNQRFYLTKCPT